MKKFNRGFTLIEVLIVVAIVGILASVVLLGLRPAIAKGRDSRRVQDMKQLQNALEIYNQLHNRYPDDLYAGGGGVTNLETERDAANNPLVPSMPSDPLNPSGVTFGNAGFVGYDYEVNTSANPGDPPVGTIYVLHSKLEAASAEAEPLKSAIAQNPISGGTLACDHGARDYCLSLRKGIDL